MYEWMCDMEYLKRLRLEDNRLRRDLVNEYGAQSAAYSGGLGFLDMCDAEDASNEQLLQMAKRGGSTLTNIESNSLSAGLK